MSREFLKWQLHECLLQLRARDKMASRMVRSLRKERQEIDEDLPSRVRTASKSRKAPEVEDFASDNEDSGEFDDDYDFDDVDDEEVDEPIARTDTKKNKLINGDGDEGYSDDGVYSDDGAFSEGEFDDDDYDDENTDDANNTGKNVLAAANVQLKSSSKQESTKKESTKKESPKPLKLKRLKLPQHLSITLAKTQKLQDLKTSTYMQPHSIGQDMLVERWQNKLRSVERSAVPPEEIWQGNPKFGSLDNTGFPETLADDQELPRELESKLWKQYDKHRDKHAEFMRSVTQTYPSGLNLLSERKMAEMIDQFGGCTRACVCMNCSAKMISMV